MISSRRSTSFDNLIASLRDNPLEDAIRDVERIVPSLYTGMLGCTVEIIVSPTSQRTHYPQDLEQWYTVAYPLTHRTISFGRILCHFSREASKIEEMQDLQIITLLLTLRIEIAYNAENAELISVFDSLRLARTPAQEEDLGHRLGTDLSRPHLPLLCRVVLIDHEFPHLKDHITIFLRGWCNQRYPQSYVVPLPQEYSWNILLNTPAYSQKIERALLTLVTTDIQETAFAQHIKLFISVGISTAITRSYLRSWEALEEIVNRHRELSMLVFNGSTYVDVKRYQQEPFDTWLKLVNEKDENEPLKGTPHTRSSCFLAFLANRTQKGAVDSLNVERQSFMRSIHFVIENYGKIVRPDLNGEEVEKLFDDLLFCAQLHGRCQQFLSDQKKTSSIHTRL